MTPHCLPFPQPFFSPCKITLYSVQCTVYSVQCTVYRVQNACTGTPGYALYAAWRDGTTLARLSLCRLNSGTETVTSEASRRKRRRQQRKRRPLIKCFLYADDYRPYSAFSTFFEKSVRGRIHKKQEVKICIQVKKTNSTIWPICIRIFLTLHHYTAWVRKPWMGI